MNSMPIRVIAKCILLLGASVLAGLTLAAAATVFVAVINRWDDSPGGGFLAIGALASGALAGLVAGFFSATILWGGRTEPGQRGRWSPVARQLKAIYLALMSWSLFTGSALSILSRGPMSAVMLFAGSFLLLWKAARMTFLRKVA